MDPRLNESGPPIYAGFGPRLLAILVDVAVWLPLVAASIAVRGVSIPLAIVAAVLMFLLGAAYTVYFLARWGQTIGKMVAGIKVVGLNGRPIAPRQAWLRSSVDISLGAIDLVAMIWVLATWTAPEWSSLSWLERGEQMRDRSPVAAVYDWVGQAWLWSELVVLLLNKKRRALHDFIAGTVVVKVRPPSSVRGTSAVGVLSDGTTCDHQGEASTYCTRCWTNLYELRRQK